MSKSKWNIKDYDYYVDEFIKISKNIGRPLYQREFKEYDLPDYRWYLKNSDKGIVNYKDFIDLCGFKATKFDSKITDDELINMLKEYYNINNKIPKFSELRQCGLPSSTMYVKRFGNYQNALVLSGIDLSNEYQFTNFRNVSDEDMLYLLKEYSINVKFPTVRDLNNNKSLPSHQTYLDRFGSFRNALLLADIKIPEEKEWLYTRKPYSKDELLYALDYFTKEKLKSDIYLISNTDLKNHKYNMPSESVYTNAFGGIKQSYSLLGIDYDELNKKALEKDMIEKYLNLFNELGYTPNSRDVDRASALGKCYGMKTYSEHFGSLLDFQTKLGLQMSASIGYLKTKEEGLEDLKKLYKELDRIPTQYDINQCEYCASCNWYQNAFGSQTNALKEAGFNNIYESKVKITPSGNVVRSSYEYDFIRMLEDCKIEFIQEEYYSKYISNLDRKLRLDFTTIIDSKYYFIEIFGIMEYEWYREKTKLKIQLCKDNNLPLIKLYKEDFLRGRDIESLYNLLMSEINNINNKTIK